jgi:transcriptional regulator with XRE-family HTH domain
MELEHCSPSQFADEIGVQRGVISHITTERNEPSKDVLIKILERYPSVNPDWLLLGKGSIRRSSNAGRPQPSAGAAAEPDLFANTAQIQPAEKKVSEIRSGMEAKRPANAPQHAVKEIVTVKETPQRRAIRITVYYSNNTYETFVPEK